MNRSLLLLWLLAIVGVLAPRAFAQEPVAVGPVAGESVGQEPRGPQRWADPSNPVVDGLQVWLDASRLQAARETLGLGTLSEGQSVDRWPDASGHGRHLQQTVTAAQPTYHVADQFHSLRFNGRDTFLSLLHKAEAKEALTIFLVAAPTANTGNFSGPLALSSPDENDYRAGLNLDQGPGFSQHFEVLNVEGAGTAGAQDLLNRKVPFGEVVRMCVVSKPGPGGIRTWVDGAEEGSRDRQPESRIRMDQIVVGARFYNNAGPADVRSFFEGEIAELLIYGRALSDDERTKVEGYLAVKYGSVPRRPATGPVEGVPLVAVENPPDLQILVPGFTARRLPVELPNINNILYRPDGRLIALAYDGNVYLLSDQDGDGVEETAELFWQNKGQLLSPIGMALTPPGYARGEGVFIAAKGKCLLLADSDGNRHADQEIVVAEGWPALVHNVDGLGVAVDPNDGSVYFGLGTKNFTDAYGVAENKQGTYPLGSERGTILRVAPDFRSREIYATGIRFPVSLRFNALGDLFCSDQEGATWLPNGNPFDELLHIQRGRHYGFPPRHPQYLPDVIDEPSVFDFTPQHQSTCGMNFNEPVISGGSTFGPDHWRSDLFTAGYSRGKVYRTALVKTQSGYVAQTQLLACLTMLASDLCLSPGGELVVATHSGGPDWGSGPAGKGALYKIFYSERSLPQPVAAWPQGPQEVRIAFDRPLDADSLAGLAQTAEIHYGRYVAAGDRFESLRPGYQVVQDQLRSPRYRLPIHNLQLSRDRRTIILATAAHAVPDTYAISLPGLGRSAHATSDEIPQHPQTELQYGLTGVEVTWQSSANADSWSGWLPHLDLAVSKRFTALSSEHEALWSSLASPGRLTLRTTLNLDSMLRPAVQPGSKIDYEWPAERVSLALRSSAALKASIDGQQFSSAAEPDGMQLLTIDSAAAKRVEVKVDLSTGPEQAGLELSWSTNEDPRPRALPLNRMLLPWARSQDQPLAQVASVDLPELRGGNWMRGKKLFLDEQVGCSKCHTFASQGGGVGPDLSNLPHRDYRSVLRDIRQPNYAINPDYVTQSVLLADGHLITGTVRTDGDRLSIGDAQGRVTTVQLDEVDQTTPSPLSTMPEGLLERLGDQGTRDLLTFLLTKPPSMPEYGGQRPPPPRSLQEVAAVLDGAPRDPEPTKKLTIVLVTGRKDHGPGEHDYPAWQKIWQQLLSMSEHAAVEVAEDWPSPGQLQSADVLVFYQQGTWNAQRGRDLDAFLARGGGAVYIHYAVDGGMDPSGFAERIGLAWKGGHSKFRHGGLEVRFAEQKEHPIARNFDVVHWHDESYWQLLGDINRVSLLAVGREEGRDQPLFWTTERGQGRVFVSIPGHFSWSFDDPLFRTLLLRGIAWTGRAPIDQFNDLVLPGARVE